MYTRKAYEKSEYLTKWDSIITSVRDSDGDLLVIFESTIFFPTGGGQNCDIGTITSPEKGSSAQITDVYIRDGVIYHVMKNVHGDFQAGDQVTMEIDWPNRFDNMQRHCGEHILSGAFYRLYGGMNKGFHMGKDFITIDVAFPEGDPYQQVTWEMAEAAEADANAVIQSDAPVTVDYFKTRSEAEKMPLRKALAFDEDISVVTVGDKSNPMDCVACCGTHPSTAGQVGLIKIYKIEPNKGMSRVFFEAGNRAYAKYREQFNVLYDLGNRLSAGYEDILSKYDKQVQRNQESRDRLHRLSQAMVAQKSSQILSDLSSVSECMLVYEEDLFTADDVLNIGKTIGPSINGLVALIDTDTNTVFLFSGGEPACGKLIKEHAPEFGGRGGGKADMARAIFPDAASSKGFIDAIKPLI